MLVTSYHFRMNPYILRIYVLPMVGVLQADKKLHKASKQVTTVTVDKKHDQHSTTTTSLCP